MANITKIIHVHLYVGYEDEASVIQCFKFMDYLKTNGIPYGRMVHFDKNTLEPLSTWMYGPNYETRTFTNYPILLWQEVYDNYDVIQMCAETIDEIAVKLLPKKALIQ